jgi:subtilisin family serine protease
MAGDHMKRLIGACAVGLTAAVAVGVAPASATPGPSMAPEYWFDNWQINQLWDQGVRGQGVRIAEIDTGVNAALPALSGRVVPGKDFGAGGDGRIDREVQEFGHGTAMASIMVGRESTLGITGLAPDAQVMPIALPLKGTTDFEPDDHLASAITWATDHGANVISMSLGGTRSPSDSPDPCPDDEQAAVYYALSKGVVLLAAAGNRGPSDNAVEEPGVCLGVLAVGATDAGGTVASFSSRHPYLALTAPGVNIPSLSRVPDVAYSGNGTSQATAITAAVIALVWSKYPKDTGRQIVTRILATLDQHTATPSTSYGYGRLDAYQAVTEAVPANAPNPVYAAADPFAARYQAVTKSARPKAPGPAAPPIQTTGSFVVGSSPRLLVPRVLWPLGVALAGLLALLTVLVLGFVRRRQRRAARSGGAHANTAGVSVDDSGVEWHEILNPQTPAPE